MIGGFAKGKLRIVKHGGCRDVGIEASVIVNSLAIGLDGGSEERQTAQNRHRCDVDED